MDFHSKYTVYNVKLTQKMFHDVDEKIRITS